MSKRTTPRKQAGKVKLTQYGGYGSMGNPYTDYQDGRSDGRNGPPYGSSESRNKGTTVGQAAGSVVKKASKADRAMGAAVGAVGNAVKSAPKPKPAASTKGGVPSIIGSSGSPVAKKPPVKKPAKPVGGSGVGKGIAYGALRQTFIPDKGKGVGEAISKGATRPTKKPAQMALRSSKPKSTVGQCWPASLTTFQRGQNAKKKDINY